MATFPHVKLTAFGALGGTTAAGPLVDDVEIWSCGLKVGIAAPGSLNTLLSPTAQDLSDLGIEGHARWKSFIFSAHPSNPFAGNSSLFSSDVHLVGVKTEAVTTTGNDDAAIPSFVKESVSPMSTSSGGFSSGRLPFTVALAMSLRGATYKRGAAAFGRVYLPVPNLGASSSNVQPAALTNGAISTETTAGFAKRFGELIDGINGTVLSSGRVAMVCNISTSAAETGLRFQNVSEVHVDNRPDTIRRRGSKLAGQGVSVQTLPVPA